MKMHKQGRVEEWIGERESVRLYIFNNDDVLFLEKEDVTGNA